MMRTVALVLAILVAGGGIAATLWLRPNSFESCHRLVTADLYRHAGSATLDPQSVDAQAAVICAGAGN